MKQHNGMKAYDIVVLLKVLSMSEGWSSSHLEDSFFIRKSRINKSLNRSKIAGLLSVDQRMVHRNAFYELIVHGLKYVFPTKTGERAVGVPTAHSSTILQNYFIFEKSDQYIWPSPSGNTEGYSIKPFYPDQPLAALHDQFLYDQLALINAIRAGRTRERDKAAELLKQMLMADYTGHQIHRV